MTVLRVHLVDGTYELFRAFYGAPAARAPDGREVGATRALLRTMLALLTPGRRDGGATHVAVAFDTVIESFRNALLPSYKTGDGIDPALREQFPLAERACRALGIVTWSMLELEADDAIATAAARLAGRADEVVICSPDKDLAQCVRPGVVLLDRRRKRTLDEAGVRAKFGVAPQSIPDWLALVGDAADGIAGLPGWGPKSASAVLARFGKLEDVPDDARAWGLPLRGAETLAATLRERRAEAMLYRTVATLRTDAPIGEDLDALAWRGADRAALAALCEEIGERDLPARVARLA